MASDSGIAPETAPPGGRVQNLRILKSVFGITSNLCNHKLIIIAVSCILPINQANGVQILVRQLGEPVGPVALRVGSHKISYNKM